ncbi:MAG: LysM peptidoglycan-binding domain-containing protein [Spirochaetales bacterium]|jgi:hypothetical protein|nr:LysM peptidoglycan-binding domain-containing protein [Spirochaetales bacterium]
MKKLIFILLVSLAVVFSVMACATTTTATTEESGPFTQEDANKAFDSIYQKYHSSLILDGAKNYTVVRGDNLSALAERNFGAGSALYFPVIMLASNEEVDDPDLIFPGLKLVIPDLKKNLNDPGARSKIKEFLGEIANVYNKKGDAVVEKKLRDLAATL